MGRVPVHTRTVLLNRSNASNIEASAAAFGGNEARQHNLNAQQHNRNAQIFGQMSDQHVAQKKAEARVNTAQEINRLDREEIPALEQQKADRQVAPTGFAQEYDSSFSEQLAAHETRLSESDQNYDIDYFRAEMDKRRTARLQKNTDWETGLRVKNTVTGAEQAIDDMNVNLALLPNPSFKDFVEHQKAIRDYAVDVGSGVFGADDIVKLTQFGIDGAATAFMNKQLQDNPKGLRRVIEFGDGGRERLAKMVGEFEKGKGSKTDEQIEAAWDARLDEYDPEFQAVAFDALVSHGASENTWDMINEADGSPEALLRIRQEEYASLLLSDPEKYGTNEKGWNNRMNELSAYAKDLKAGGSEFLEYATLIDSEIIAKTRKAIPQALKDREKAQEAELIAARETSIIEKIQNEDAMLESVIYNDKLSLKQRIEKIREADLGGLVTDEFATESIQYLNSSVNAKKTVSAEKKFAAFNSLTEELQAIRVKMGGTPDSVDKMSINTKTLQLYKDFQQKVLQKLVAGEITEGEAKSFTKDFSASISAAINENETESSLSSLLPGVQDAYGYAFDKIDATLENSGQEGNLALKKEMILKFQSRVGDWESSGSTGADERRLNGILKEVKQSINAQNFAGKIDPENPPNAVVRKRPVVLEEHIFNNVAEMEAAKLTDGTPVMVNGVAGYSRSR